MDQALEKTLDAAVKIFGSKRKFAIKLGISAQALQQWRRVPDEHIFAVAKLTELELHELRPDLYQKGMKFRRTGTGHRRGLR